MKAPRPLILATRPSPLAIAQARLVAERLALKLGRTCELRRIVTTGDRRLDWPLEKQGGKGVFTAEIEEALRSGQADLAVHSAKDLPGDSAADLMIAGYLPRADARDVLVRRKGIGFPRLVATGSPRRRAQLRQHWPGMSFVDLRGNVETRLRKLAAGAADATVLAAAGLARLGISQFDGLEFLPLDVSHFVPAVAQGAIAVQCSCENAILYQGIFDPVTALHVELERALQARLGAGCHTAFAAHVTPHRLHLWRPETGYRMVELDAEDLVDPAATARRLLPGPAAWAPAAAG